ncbi:MAG: ribonuclease HII [Elusimicrobiaceae bacterium]|nr:ribonuclease HII [Elusimicrobiaceae bacterium]
MNSLQDFDKKKALQLGTATLLGIDEAGRGPLAGPVVACACHIAPNQFVYFEDVNDSKKLTAHKREEIFERLQTAGVLYGVGFASAREIDQLNILQATFLAMRRAAHKFYSIPNAVALIDGPHPVRDLPLRQEPVIDGDALSLNIAAASIVAKVLRDRYLDTLDKLYPNYSFAAHKGYGTAQHLAALKKYGPCPEHRRTFAPVRNLYKPTLFP